MIMSLKNKYEIQLLREYLRVTLNEDYDGGGGSDYGVAYGSPDEMMSTFIGPFTDVFQTAVGKTKEITRKTRTLLNVSFKALLSTFFPFIGADYKSIFDEEKADIDKIRSQYKDVYDRTDKAMAGNDAAMLAFMVNPGVAMSAWAVKQTPKVIKGTFSALTGGMSDDIYGKTVSAAKEAGNWMTSDDSGSNRQSSRKSRHRREEDEDESDELRKKMLRGTGNSGSQREVTPKDVAISLGGMGEGRLFEKKEDEGDKKKITPKTILTNKKFMKKVLSSPHTLEMQKIATATYQKTLKAVYTHAENVMKKVKTIEDLEKIAKKKVPEAEQIKKLPPDEKVKAEKMLIDGIRKSTKDFYIKNLKDHVSGVVKAGIPEESQYVVDYKAVIQKIEAL
jgi:hypothetical protein